MEEICEEENWKPVVGYNGLYEVSDLGRVCSIAHSVKILSQLKNRGYRQVSLYKNGKDIRFYVHRLVAAAFIGCCPKSLQVNHIDGNKANNNIHNLEYVTCSENVIHAHAKGLCNPIRGGKHPMAKLTEEDVLEIRRRLLNGETQKTIADSFNVKHQAISKIGNRSRWTNLK